MPVRPFTDTLRKIRRGGLADELSEELNRLTKAIAEGTGLPIINGNPFAS